jgi:galactitol-specific phosphotransferase system IIC component
VTLEVDLYTLWHEALTAFLATATDEVTACFSLHAGAKSVLLLAGSLGWLVSAFHWPV